MEDRKYIRSWWTHVFADKVEAVGIEEHGERYCLLVTAGSNTYRMRKTRSKKFALRMARDLASWLEDGEDGTSYDVYDMEEEFEREAA